MHVDAPIVKGPGVTQEAMLSDTVPALKGTGGDTKVFVFDSGQPGGTFVVLGGTHPQEIAGMLAATLLVENARVTRGKLIVVPQANHTGFTHTDPMEAYFHSIEIARPDGSKRWFPVGMRLSNPANQWPDPDSYVHMPSGERMVGHESRNLNRNHPGLSTSTVTAQISYGLTGLVKGANIVLDLHEAQPEYPVINKVVYHQRANAVASTATCDRVQSCRGRRPHHRRPIAGQPSRAKSPGVRRFHPGAGAAGRDGESRDGPAARTSGS
jgi:predicted deacylase